MDPAEEKALRLVVMRLHRRFPDVSVEDLDREVHRIYEDYAGSRARTYIPILVEKDAAADVRAGSVTS